MPRTVPSDADASSDTLIERLRAETSAAHASLESALGLTRGGISQSQMLRLLTRFYGFYRMWDPWVTRAGLADSFVRPRLKLTAVETDLRKMGVADHASIAIAPMTLGAPTVAHAFGSLYVIEGSMLGGRVINNWIEGAAWLPPEGLRYFRGYGRNTHAMWRQYQAALARYSETKEHDGVLRAAKRTFGALHVWLCPDEDVACV